MAILRRGLIEFFTQNTHQLLVRSPQVSTTWLHKTFIIGISCARHGGWVFVIDIHTIKFVLTDHLNCRCRKFFNRCVVDGTISIGGHSVEATISHTVTICIKVTFKT
ncbi:Uncharacterised protein [Vibrio cholerae]|nr:Uncharacterised protein [Vibrio cholerae]